MRDLAATEHHGHLYLVFLLKKPPSVARLRFEVMIIDARTELHFLQLDDVLLLLRDAGLLGHLELVLAVVHDADDRRACSRRHFDKIEPCFLGHTHRDIHFEYAELRSIRADDADRADANLPIDSHPLCGVLNRRCSPEGKKQKTRTPETGIRAQRAAPWARPLTL